MKNQVTIFFDAGYNLCSREVQQYRRLDRVRALHCVDFSIHTDQPENLHLTRAADMDRLRVVDSAGQLDTGAAAFVDQWSALPYYRWLVVRAMATSPESVSLLVILLSS